MTTFINSIGTQSTIAFEHSHKDGWIVLKMYTDKSTHGNCYEIPIAAFKEIIERGQKLSEG